ncbi:hypothetical protein H7J86_26435 [Mycobacterium hackensackense]|uniref:hypothetical protein n=1 Tax=Mycobacterium hackensackense TaxID=228909 RepID=UPI002265D2DF|nr:hypothetical protein [Mycobacterium hackensackense]MCV7255708.1 hypothetical protein [Mycobacterium hackensackense]
MGIARDVATSAGQARALDLRASVRSGGAVLYQSNFDQGMDGWIDHWGGYAPQLAIGRTSEICHTGSHCLMLSTGEHAAPPADDVSSFVSAFKRLARHSDDFRYVSYSAFLAVGIGNYNGAWESFLMYIDTQKQDNSSRSFYFLRCSRVLSGTYQGVTLVNEHGPWLIRGDTGATPEQRMIRIPGSAHMHVGDNENKQNFQYVRLTVDLKANAGLGGYKELQVGEHVFDLSTLGAGKSTEPIQGGTGIDIDDFAGGFNIGLGIGRNIAIADGCQLMADNIVVSASKAY